MAGDEIELTFERAYRLTREPAPTVEVLDRAAFQKGIEQAERAAELARG